MTSSHIHVVTGASGFIGRHLVREMLKKGECVLIVLRPHDGETVEQRAKHIFGAELASQLEVVEGDVTKPLLGISDTVLQKLQAGQCTVWHLAADLSFLPDRMLAAVETNQQGTEQVVVFANAYATRLVHMSTAYVCGDATGLYTEEQLFINQGFRNYYERSKYEAETIVRQKASVPHIIFRPSIVIGDAYEGKAEGCTFGYYRFAFMIHTFRLWVIQKLSERTFVSTVLRMFGTTQKGKMVRVPWLIVPYPSNGVVDMVAIDYVVSSMLQIVDRPEAWSLKTFHLTQQQPVQSLTVMQVAMEDIGIEGVRYVKVFPWIFHVLMGLFYILAIPLRRYMKSVYWYIPYVIRPYHFDHAHTALLDMAPPPPITPDFLHRINAYAKNHVFTSIYIDKLF